MRQTRVPGSATPNQVRAFRETLAAVGELIDVDRAGVRFEVVAEGGGRNAWTEDGPGGPTSYLALDRLPAEPSLRRCLVAHEALHALHRRVRPGAWPPIVATKLWDEALAMLVSRALEPGLGDAEIAAIGDAEPDWLDRCDAAWPETRAALTDETRFAELFARPKLRPPGATLPARCGYAAAVRLGPALAGGEPLAKLVRLDAAAAAARVRVALGAVESVPGTGTCPGARHRTAGVA